MLYPDSTCVIRWVSAVDLRRTKTRREHSDGGLLALPANAM